VLIMGDFNYPEINWIDTTSPPDPNHKATQFVEAVRDAFLFQHVKNPTHYRSDQTPNTLDLVFTNEEGMIEKIQHSAPLGKSHHQILAFEYKCYTITKPKETRYIYEKGDYGTLRSMLKEVNWTEMMSNENTDSNWSIFTEIMNEAIRKTVPKTKIDNNDRKKKKKLPIWTNEQALIKIKKKRHAYQRYMETREGKDYLLYARARNQAKTECRRAIWLHEKNIAKNAKKNPKAFYAYARGKMKTRDGIADLEDKTGKEATTDEEKAHMLNEFFCSVFTNEDTSHIPDFEERKFENELRNIEVSREEVMKKLKALKIDKSPGPDALHPRILKEAAEEIALPLAHIFNKSREESKLPQIWKDANVSPLFKKGKRSDPGNYRPVSLTCIICKVMESIIRDRLMKHMDENKLLSDHQHGFLSGRSSSTNLLKVLDSWTESLDGGTPLDAVYLDFAKAFDSVPHERLLTKLNKYGVRGDVLGWIRQFLTGRRQRVRVNGAESSWKPVTSGIPQGSVLGPVLFVIFINDLPEVTSCPVEMFADDTKLYSPLNNHDDQVKLQEDIHKLTEWASKWQLRFNAGKCKILHLGRSNPEYEYKMKNEYGEEVTLGKTELEKDLGINIDPTLKFSQHIEIQVNKANKILGLIRRSYEYLDQESFRMLFTSLVRPHLEYCNVAWAPRLQKDKKLVESVLRRGTKLVPGMKDLPYEVRLQRLNIPSMAYRRARGDMIETYKYTHNIYKTDPFLILDQDNTRRGHQYKLKKQACKTATRQNFFSFRIVNAWNSLPEKVVSAPSVNSFKSRLDSIWSDHKFKIDLPCLLPQAKLEYIEKEECEDQLTGI
jgi:hypothetical protein